MSQRARLAPASPIRKLVPLADDARSRGTHVYHLNIGQPDIVTPEPMLAALHDYEGPVLAYAPSGGLPEFVEVLADYYRRCGIDVARRDIMVTTAASEALVFALAATLDPGDEVLIPEPLYANYLGFSALLGLQVRPVTCAPENGYMIPPPEELDRMCGPRTKAVILCNPGNPTGRVTGKDELERLGEWICERGLYLIGDEVYREFCYTGQAPPSILNLKGCEERTIMVDSLSKRFSACGARIGCVVTRNAEVAAGMLKFAQARLSPPTLGQLMGIRAYRDLPAAYYHEVVETYRERRDLLCTKLEAIPGVFCRKPEGAFYLMARLPVDDSEAFTRWMLTDFQMDGETIMMAPGAGFYATPGLGQKEVRIAYVLETGRLERAMGILAAGLAQYPGRD
ncbi:MAG: aminotransferase class I/II-fold pyridoxal phosphate-dependent enzyme [Candidatus Eisenbacteria bacterium]|nr:aminotransferase class I/II-fold pyridoxal phosphate-dependent enzyme [Candidatus Eisenbacteria bacterium]